MAPPPRFPRRIQPRFNGYARWQAASVYQARPLRPAGKRTIPRKDTPLKPLTLTVALGLGLIMGGLIMGSAVFASGYEKISDGMRMQITTQLAAEGYEMRKIGREDGMIEVCA